MLDVVSVVTKVPDEDDFGNAGFGLVDQPVFQFVFGLLNLVKVNGHPANPLLIDDTPVAGGVVPSDLTCITIQARSLRACTHCRRKKNHRWRNQFRCEPIPICPLVSGPMRGTVSRATVVENARRCVARDSAGGTKRWNAKARKGRNRRGYPLASRPDSF